MKTTIITWIIIILLIGTGWIKDIIKLTDCDFKAPYKCEIIYGVGIVPIIGSVTGWIDIDSK